MTAVTDDYAGPFDPDWTLERLSRAGLARLGREYMLGSMFHDRALMPHIAVAHGQDATIAHADAEWMSSSPVYTRRNKANLGIVGDGVGEALKSFQFDIGCPHNFLDFHYELVDHDLGYFWLPFCGAHDYLRQISGNDPEMVTNMCHHMEDRTFDATLGATNPLLRAIPIHRPPKPDAFTGDHCRWEVRVVDTGEGARDAHPGLAIVESSEAARFAFETGDAAEPGGLEDYAGEFVPDLRLEDLSHPVLVRQAKEFALDVHLLMRAAYLSVDANFDAALLDDAAPQHRAAIAPALVTRLRRAMGVDGDDMHAVAKILQLDPFLVDDYVRYRVEVDDETSCRIWFEDCAGLADDVCRSPLTWLRDDPDRPGIDAMARAVNPRAAVERIDPASVDGDAVLAFDIRIDPGAEPVEPHWAAEMVAGGGIVDFDLSEHPVPIPTRR